MAARVPLFEGIDDPSALAVMLVQLVDIYQLDPGHTTNEDRTLQALKSELEKNVSILRDRLIAARLDPTGTITARGLHQAARLNRPVVQIAPNTSQLVTVAEISPPPTRSPSVVSDSATSSSNSSSQKGNSIPTTSELNKKPSPTAPASNGDEALSQSSAVLEVAKSPISFVIRQGDEDEATPAESSTCSAATKRNRSTGIKCASCMDDIPSTQIAHLPCEHDYCGPCILQLFNTSLVDETLFPPRCCKQLIPPAEFRAFLTPEIIESYAKKKQELETTDRTYCSDPSCSIFMRPENIAGDCATCPECKKVTCTMCKAPAHEGDCPADESLQKLLELAKEAGWQRCSSCKAMVSITMGCNCMRFVTLSLNL
jgi:hypothetical protein